MATGSQFNLAQLVDLAQQAGWSAQEAPTIAAVAMAESGGRAGALNNNPASGDLSYGLTQVNMIDRLGPARRQQLGLRSNDELYDPLVNLRAAKAIKDSQGWGAWSVVKGGQYKQYLPAAQQALQSGGGVAVEGALGALEAALTPAPTATPAARRPDLDPGALAAAALAAPTAGARFAGEAALAPALMAAVLGPPAGAVPAAATSAAPARPALPAATAALESDGASVGLVDFLRQVQAKGLRVGEHPAFGRVGRHSPNSHHYRSDAADLTDWNSGDWRARKRYIGEVARQALGGQGEVFHPGYDPVGGHGSHIHFAAPGGRLPRSAATRILAGIDEAFRRYPRT